MRRVFVRGRCVLRKMPLEWVSTRMTPIPLNGFVDSHGNHRYDLSIEVERAEPGDQVISWSLVLKDLRHPKAGNILMSAPEASTDPTQDLWKLDLSRSSAVPTRVKRIIKVDGFYVTIEVKDVHFPMRDAQYPDLAYINLTITNRDPRPGQ